jgi:hypothetical protein
VPKLILPLHTCPSTIINNLTFMTMSNDNSPFKAVFRLTREGIEISGSESFVRDQVTNFRPDIQEYLLELSKAINQPLLPPASDKRHAVVASQNNLAITERPEDIDFVEVNTPLNVAYENVLEIQSDKIQIITDIPGENLAKRMINLILIYMWGNLLINKQEISFSELREICKRHGELDGTNFAKYMNANKKYFIISGSGKYQQVKLIRPGLKEASKIITELNKD